MMAFPDTYLITLYRLQMMALFGGGNERGLVKYTSQLKHERKIIPLPPAITSVAVAGRILQTGDELLPFSSSFMEKISLPADKNNIAFTFLP